MQDALKVVGIDYTPEPELQPLDEILKGCLRAAQSHSWRVTPTVSSEAGFAEESRHGQGELQDFAG